MDSHRNESGLLVSVTDSTLIYPGTEISDSLGRTEQRRSRRVRVVGEDASSTRTVEEAVATFEADSVSSVATLTPARVDVVVLVSPALGVDVSTAVQRVRQIHGETPIVVVASDVPETRTDAVVPVEEAAIERTVTEVLDQEPVEQVRRRLQRLSAFVAELDDVDGVEDVSERLVDGGDYDSAWIVQREGSSLVPAVAAGVPLSALRVVDVDSDAPWARAAETGESVVDTDDVSTIAIPFDDKCLVCTTKAAVSNAELASLERAVSSIVSIDDDIRPRYALLGEAVAHEVNNQLDLAMVHLDLVDEKGEHLEYVEAALNRIDDVVAEVNALVAPELSVDEVSLEATSEDVWEGVSTDAASLDAHAGTVEADDRLLRLLLTNLFRNSVQHGGDDEVTVEVGPLDSGGFYVADDGVGFSEESPEHLFEWGWSDNGGTGIGLALVSLAADRHGWDVETRNDDGARFEFKP